MNPPPWRKAEIIRIHEEAPHTQRFWIRIPELTQFDFEPGQHVTLDLPIGDKASRRYRSYSIASPPDGTNIFELVIVENQDLPATNYIFHEMKVGTELMVRGPQGNFCFRRFSTKTFFLFVPAPEFPLSGVCCCISPAPTGRIKTSTSFSVRGQLRICCTMMN
jgi:CDP-4-dehydro-6-deoxyglucose reductase